MSLLTQYDNAMVRGQRSVPVISRLGGGTLATIGDNTPFRVAGATAVVYQLRQPTGKVLALRAWHARDPDADTIERYRALSRSDLLGQFRTHPNSPLVHTLAYHPDAVLIEADDSRDMNRPMVVLDWVMGPTVLAAVDRACRAKDGAYLNALAGAWRTAIEVGADIGFVHGDLSGSNAIVRPKEGIAFVDYDTAYWGGAPSVPKLDPAPAWRHRDGVPADPERVDDFPALLMYASLRLLAVWPELRMEHGQPATVKDAGLLFSPRDLANPDGSALFGKARVISDTGVLALIGVLRELALAPVDDLPTFAAALEMADHIARSGPLVPPPVTAPRRQQTRRPSATTGERPAPVRSAEPAPPAPGPDEPASYWPAHQRAWNPDALSELAGAVARGDLARAEMLWTSVATEPGATALLPALHLLRNEGRTGVA
ncbi:MAG: hypothetical protein M3Y37_00800, partial [Chloroflexota bacterium]|nr:hypothetical protein [Chloroflexota bacterium]